MPHHNNPTKTALAKHKCAVVILMASSNRPEQIAWDFEWFDRTSQSDDFMKEMVDIANDEVAENGVYYLLASVDDTATMSVKEIKVVHQKGKEAETYCKEWAERVAADTTLLVYTEKKKPSNVAETTVVPEKKEARTVKGRKPSAAAAAADGAAGSTGPVPRGAARKTAAAKADAAKAAPTTATPKAAPAAAKTAPAAKATTATPSTLKARIAAKKEAEPVNALVALDALFSSSARKAARAARITR